MWSTERHRQQSAALFDLAAVSLAILTILTVWKLKQFKYRLINETGGALFFGMLLGLLVKYLWFDGEERGKNVGSECTCPGINGTPHVLMVNATSHQRTENNSQRCSLVSTFHMGTFDPEVLFDLFLPTVIFYGAYTLNQKRLIQNLGSILTYAFLGTFISCICIGCAFPTMINYSDWEERACIYGVTRLMVLLGHAADGEFFLTDCLLFGAIMSATDPDISSVFEDTIQQVGYISLAHVGAINTVSVLGLLSHLRLDFDLHALLFGESVLNDAMAIVLTHAIATYHQMGTGSLFDPPAFLHSVGFFLGVLIGSFLLGFIFTVITALLTKFTRLHESPLLETSVFFLLSWSSFLSAEACGLSGIVAVLFCGLSQARYTTLNLSDVGRTRTEQLFEVFNFLGEIFIFSYMGYIWFLFPHHVFQALFISGAFLSIFFSRACNIYPLSFLLNLRRTNKISPGFQHFMVFAGLRGVIAFSLAIRDTSTKAKQTILTTTLLLVVFTVWVLGAAADPLLRHLDLSRVEEDLADEDLQDHSSEDVSGRPNATRGLWNRLDHQYLKPLLTHCGPPLTDSLPQWCGGFAKVFSSPRLQEDEEQFCEAQLNASTVSLEKTELATTPSGSGSEHQEDLLEGDLGLGTSVSQRSEFPGVSSNADLSSPPPTVHGETVQGI